MKKIYRLFFILTLSFVTLFNPSFGQSIKMLGLEVELQEKVKEPAQRILGEIDGALFKVSEEFYIEYEKLEPYYDKFLYKYRNGELIKSVKYTKLGKKNYVSNNWSWPPKVYIINDLIYVVGLNQDFATKKLHYTLLVYNSELERIHYSVIVSHLYSYDKNLPGMSYVDFRMCNNEIYLIDRVYTTQKSSKLDIYKVDMKSFATDQILSLDMKNYPLSVDAFGFQTNNDRVEFITQTKTDEGNILEYNSVKKSGSQHKKYTVEIDEIETPITDLTFTSNTNNLTITGFCSPSVNITSHMFHLNYDLIKKKITHFQEDNYGYKEWLGNKTLKPKEIKEYERLHSFDGLNWKPMEISHIIHQPNGNQMVIAKLKRIYWESYTSNSGNTNWFEREYSDSYHFYNINQMGKVEFLKCVNIENDNKDDHLEAMIFQSDEEVSYLLYPSNVNREIHAIKIDGDDIEQEVLFEKGSYNKHYPQIDHFYSSEEGKIECNLNGKKTTQKLVIRY